MDQGAYAVYMYINVYLHMGIATCGHQVEGEESRTAEEINVRALLPKDRGAHFHLD